MYSSSDKNIESGYSTIRLVTDPTAENPPAVGVVGWDADREWYDVRVLQQDEKISGVKKSDRKLLQVATKQLHLWASSGEVPYFREEAVPWSSRFWERTRKALSAGVRLDSPKALEPEITVGEQLEGLFEAVVQPERDDSASREKINGKVSRALGELASRMRYYHELPAFADGQAKVMRSLSGPDTTVIVDGVNLAGSDARDEADALASKIRRIRKGQRGRRVISLVGYMASPGGLNGEGDMEQWIREESDSRTYNLDLEKDDFREATREALAEFEAQGFLDFVTDGQAIAG